MQENSVNLISEKQNKFSRKILASVIFLTILLIGAGFYIYWTKNAPKDPFASIKPDTFGTSGKVAAIDGDTITFEAAVSSIRGGVSYISYESKKAVISSNTLIYKKIDGLKNQATINEIKINSEISILTTVNPNANTELPVTELVVN